MNSINRFYGLAGRKIHIDELLQLKTEAIEEGNFEVVERINKFIANNPNATKFHIVSVDKICPISETEILFLEEINDQEQIGLGRPVSSNEIYDLVNNLMLNTIKEVGFLPWQKEWVGNGENAAMNYVTGKPYTGINYYLLNFDTSEIVDGKRIINISERRSPYFLTFKQIEQLGGKLKKGAKGVEVVYYNFIFNYRDNEHKFSTTDGNALEKFVKENKITEAQIETNLSKIPMLKYYKVFSFDDCIGIPAKKVNERKIEPIEIAEKIILGYPKKPRYQFGTDKAFYSPGIDIVSMPKIKAFKNEAFYYTTFFHEIVHSTGHDSRLGRDLTGRFGNEKYAFEELIAELGAVYLSSEAGILFQTRNNSAKYLRGWNARLVKKMEDDNRFFMRAAAEAQKAANFILGDKKHLEVIVVENKNVKKQQKVKILSNPNITKETSDQAKNAVIKLREKQQKKQDLENINPKPFANKPKSVSLQTAIKDVLSLKKYNKVSALLASIIYKKFNDNDFVLESDLFSNYELGILKKDSPFHINFDDEIELLGLGQDFIKAVNGRLESLRNQKNNYALFDGLNARKSRKKTKSKLNAPVIVQEISHDTPVVVPVITIDSNKTEPVLIQNEFPSLAVPVNQQKEVHNPSFEEPKNEVRTLPKKYKTAADRIYEKENSNVEIFELNGDLGVFLGQIERKPVHSLAITLDTEEGGGKTHTIYQWANIFYESGYSPVIWSLEEHASSSLSTSKAENYFGKNITNIPILSEETEDSKEETFEKFMDSINDFDVIFIDSWNKLVEINNTIKFDQDIRKKFHGKIFIVIVQRTADGKMRGGSSFGFDGDIILKGEVDRSDFRNNFIYNHKNRYNEYVPMADLKYSPYHQRLLPLETNQMIEI